MNLLPHSALAVVLVACGMAHDPSEAGVDAGSRDASHRDAGPPPAPFARGVSDMVQDVAVDDEGNIFALARTGALWAWTADGGLRFGPLDLAPVPVPGRNALVALREGAVVSSGHGARSVSADGEERWHVPVSGACAIARGTDRTVAVAGTAEIVVLDEDTGVLVRALEAPSACTYDEALVLAGAPDGAYAVAPPIRIYTRAGDLIGGHIVPMRRIFGMAVAPDGTLAVAGFHARGDTRRGFDIPTPQNFDPLLLIYNADVTPRVAVSFRGPDFEHAYGVAADADGFRVTGRFGEFGNAIDIGDFHVESNGLRNAFLAHVGLDGVVRDARSIPGQGVLGMDIARHPSGRWVVGGILFPGPLEPPGLSPVEGDGFVYLGWE